MAGPFVEVPVRRWARGTLSETRDFVTEEVPVALVYHGVPHVVMLASPADLEDPVRWRVDLLKPRVADRSTRPDIAKRLTAATRTY